MSLPLRYLLVFLLLLVQVLRSEVAYAHKHKDKKDKDKKKKDKHDKSSVKHTDYKIDKVEPLLVVNNDVVAVTFHTKTPAAGDFIAAFSPRDADINETAPIAYGNCESSPGYLSTGKGTLNFEMTTLSSDVAFYYYIGSVGFFNTTYPGVVWGTPTTQMASKYKDTVQFMNTSEPIRIRVIPTGGKCRKI